MHIAVLAKLIGGGGGASGRSAATLVSSGCCSKRRNGNAARFQKHRIRCIRIQLLLLRAPLAPVPRLAIAVACRDDDQLAACISVAVAATFLGPCLRKELKGDVLEGARPVVHVPRWS